MQALHTADLAPDEIEPRRGYSLTTPLRTLQDVAADETNPSDLIAQAARDAIRTGLIPQAKLEKGLLSFPEKLRRLLSGKSHP